VSVALLFFRAEEQEPIANFLTHRPLESKIHNIQVQTAKPGLHRLAIKLKP
jgi:hypothetical protein